MSPFRVNLGGEGEEPGVLNQQGPWVILNAGWLSSRTARPFADLVANGIDFLICENTAIPFPDNCLDEVITNGVPIDVVSIYGPGVQSSEIQRILKVAGVWIHDGNVVWTKP
jgi:hypothetical protein